MSNLLLSVTQFSDNLVSILSNSLGIWYLIILNAFGVIAICCKVCEYQLRGRKTIFLLAMSSQTLWVLYFVCQGDFISAIASGISFVSVLIFSQREKHAWARSVLWLIFFLALQGALTVFTFKTWRDLFALSAGVLGVFAYYTLDLKKYRFLSLFYALSWLCNSIFKMYPIALASDAFSTISVSIGIYRYDIKKQKSTEQVENKID
jgi:hypothetical protein